MQVPEEKIDLLIQMFEQHEKRLDQMETSNQKNFDQIEKGFEQIEKRFEQVEKRFEQVEKRFEQVFEQIKDLKDDVRELKRDVKNERDKLQEVYESRDKVTVTFGRAFPVFNAFVSGIVAFIVVFFTKS